MGRLDRLVRAATQQLEPGEGLLASLCGRHPERRGHVAVVATDRRVLVVHERFHGVEVRAVAYAEITGVEREHGVPLGVTLVTPDDPIALTRIRDGAGARVALGLIERRVRGAATAAPGDWPAERPQRVRVLL